jgi:hypothetical protein
MKSTVFSVEDGGNTFMQNVGLYANYMAFQPIRLLLVTVGTRNPIFCMYSSLMK